MRPRLQYRYLYVLPSNRAAEGTEISRVAQVLKIGHERPGTGAV